MKNNIDFEELNEDRDVLNDLLVKSDMPVMDPVDDAIEPMMVINIDEIDSEATKLATFVTERLADYYFDEKYIHDHPYIEPKIMSEMQNIRRLNKMLLVNEKAQDSLLLSITSNAAKGSLYSALTSLQQATLNIQRQLEDLIKELEDIFRKMNDECKMTFEAKDKDIADDGTMTIRGSKDFIKQITQKLYGEKVSMVNTATGEVISSTTNYTVTEE